MPLGVCDWAVGSVLTRATSREPAHCAHFMLEWRVRVCMALPFPACSLDICSVALTYRPAALVLSPAAPTCLCPLPPALLPPPTSTPRFATALPPHTPTPTFCTRAACPPPKHTHPTWVHPCFAPAKSVCLHRQLMRHSRCGNLPTLAGGSPPHPTLVLSVFVICLFAQAAHATPLM